MLKNDSELFVLKACINKSGRISVAAVIIAVLLLMFFMTVNGEEPSKNRGAGTESSSKITHMNIEGNQNNFCMYLSCRSPAEPDRTEKTGFFNNRTYVIAAAAIITAAILEAAAATAYACKNKYKKNGAIKIPARLEVCSGRQSGKKHSLYLTERTLIGNDAKKCGIVIKDTAVSPINSAVTVDKTNTVYIEDLSSQYGTAIDGMRIYVKNRLGSGDMISIGNVNFILLF